MNPRRASTKCKVLQAALEQMIGGELGNSCMIRADIGKAQILHGAAKIDHGNAGAGQRIGDLPRLDTSEDSIPLPPGQPRRGRIAEAVGMKIGGPAAMIAVVFGHAAQ